MPPIRRIVAAGVLAALVTLSGCTVTPGPTSVGVSVGIHVPAYPRLVLVPGFPVYYAPGLSINLFFYDGLYWVFHADGWYASTWYDGPWAYVSPYEVPWFLLRIPVRYYRQPPPYFRDWAPDAPPRWDLHFGRDWVERRSDWDRPTPRPAPPAAPLPDYQRDYRDDRYPRESQRQDSIRSERYSHEPRDDASRRQLQRPRSARPGSEREPRR